MTINISHPTNLDSGLQDLERSIDAGHARAKARERKDREISELLAALCSLFENGGAGWALGWTLDPNRRPIEHLSAGYWQCRLVASWNVDRVEMRGDSGWVAVSLRYEELRASLAWWLGVVL